MINYLTRIHFGEGILAQAMAEEIAAAAMRRPLIVSDKGLVDAGLVDRLKDALPDGINPVVFSDTPENPTEAAARAAAELYREDGCDGLIALGGGSPIDLAKAAAVAVTHDGPLADYAVIHGGLGRITGDLPPLLAVPTTAGTGSEVGRGSLIIVEDGRKLALISPKLIPTAAICDPTLTYGLPPVLTAATGMDAITHCIETFWAPAYNPPADGIALEGLRLGWGAIEAATTQSTPDARRDMMIAATMGALAFQKGLGAVHAASHALGGLKGKRLHHGMLNAVLLPHAIRFNAGVCADRYPRLVEAMGLTYDGPEAFAATITDRVASLGLPTTLSEMGVAETDIGRCVDVAVADHSNATNPRVGTVEDYAALMRAAL